MYLQTIYISFESISMYEFGLNHVRTTSAYQAKTISKFKIIHNVEPVPVLRVALWLTERIGAFLLAIGLFDRALNWLIHLLLACSYRPIKYFNIHSAILLLDFKHNKWHKHSKMMDEVCHSFIGIPYIFQRKVLTCSKSNW